MKRHKGLFETLCTFEHLLAAFRRALRGSGHSREALRFYVEYEPRLLALQADLMSGQYQPQPYRYFHIRDPKERVISVAPFVDRVVHHAVVGLLEPIYERRFIYDSYATRKGKGSHAAILRAQQFLRRYNWFFKTDIEQYFASINHERLLTLLARKVKDAAFLDLTARIIHNGDHAGRGLPIGNLTSQFFANVYLDPFDHWVKTQLKVQGYVRYMDDFVLFAHDREQAKAWRGAVSEYLLNELNLRLKPANSFLNQRSNGLSFLGARIFPALIRIHPAHLRRSQRRLAHKTALRQAGKMEEEDYLHSLQCHWAWLRWFDTLALRRELARKLNR